MSKIDITKDTLIHWGVKGMKWGIRKDRSSAATSPKAKETYQERYMRESVGAQKTSVKAKNGDILSIEKEPLFPLAVAVAKMMGRKPADNVVTMLIKNPSGEKVGSFQVWDEGSGVVRGEWLAVNSSHQGRGYSEAAIRGLIKAAETKGDYKEARLMVPSDAEPAKHIYSKIGFQKDKDLGDAPGYGNLEDWVYKLKS